MSPVPDVGHVARKPPRDEEDGVDPHVIAGAGVAQREALGGDRDAAQAIGVERPGGGFLGAALLDLDKGERTAAPRDEVDLATGNPRALGEDAPAVEAEPPGSDGFGAAAARFGGRAFQSPRPNRSARA